MINYNEKGPGLHEAIRAAGHVLRQENGEWIASDEAAVQAIINGYSLADARSAVSDAIDIYAKQMRDKFLKGFSSGEISSWLQKYNEAKAYQASGLAADAPTLQAEATHREITLASLATKVINKFNTTSAKEAKIAGLAGKHKDALTALGTFALINAYDWQTGMNQA